MIFPLVGHTKGHSDQVMGLIGSKIGHREALTWEAWTKMILDALRQDGNKDYRILQVAKNLLVPKYNDAFAVFHPERSKPEIDGLARAQVIRLCVHPFEDRCEMHYQEDPRLQGYLPRHAMPCAEGFQPKHWQKVFR